MSRIKFFNIYIDNITMKEAVEKIDKLIQNRKCSYVVTPNLDHIVRLDSDSDFLKVYQNADLVVTDGKPLIWISKRIGHPIKEKISGSDLFPKICELAANKGYTIFIMGAQEGVAAKAAENLKDKYRNLRFVGTYSPSMGFENKKDELYKMKQMIVSSKPDILAVSLGSPKGEKFVFEHLEEYNVPLSISIGATVDFEAGNIKRAPKWMSNIGLEWLYRITQDPSRLIKRYFYDAIRIVPIIHKYKKR